MPFRSAGGYELHTRRWLLHDGTVKGIVVIAHGLSEHSGRYQHVADYLCQGGYAVHALDHYGHGQSEGRRSFFDDLNQPVRDLAQFIEIVRAEHPDRPLWLYGHSTGALVALLVTLDHPHVLSGLIVSGITLGLTDKVPVFLAQFNRWLDGIVPWLPVAPLGVSDLSRDPDVIARYKADPLIYTGRVRARMSHFLLAESARARARLSEVQLPLLILHGGRDLICPCGGSQLLCESVSSPDTTLKIYPDLYHEIHNEAERETVLRDIVTWLDEHG